MSTVLSLVGREKELFFINISNITEEFKSVFSSVMFWISSGAGPTGQAVPKKNNLPSKL
jgi:hypothetical protein